MLKLQAPSKLNISPNTRYPMTAIQRSYVSKVSWNRKKFDSIFMWTSFEWKIWLLFHLQQHLSLKPIFTSVSSNKQKNPTNHGFPP